MDPGTTQQSSNTVATDLSTLDDVQRLEWIVEQFRIGDITKSRAIAFVTTQLDIDLSKEEPEKLMALDHYLATIDTYERLAVGASQRGIYAAGLATGDECREVLQGRHGREARAHSQDRDETRPFLHSLTTKEVPKRRRHQRRSSPVSGSRSDTGGESGSERGVSSKRRKIYERDMPWYEQEVAARQTGSSGSEESRRMLLLIGDNVSAIKRWVAVAKSAPRGSPMSEWENIVKGKSVNLDVVLSSLHHVAPVKEHVGRVGPTEVSLGRSEPTRRVHTSGEWTSVWNATVKATSCLHVRTQGIRRLYEQRILVKNRRSP